MFYRVLRKFLWFVGLPLLLIVALVAGVLSWHLVFWPPSETVTIASAQGVELAGTLALPSGDGPFPAVLVLHGSGRENRSEPSYRVTVNALRRHGFAVLLYDKRGTGESTGDFEAAGFRDFIADAVSAVAFLRARSDIDSSRIGLFGNSESGWLTPEIASIIDAAFVINRAGSPVHWVDTVLWENRSDALSAGVPESAIDQLQDLDRRRWAYYSAAAADPSVAEGQLRANLEADMATARATVPHAADALPDQLADYDPVVFQTYAEDIATDPRVFLEATDIPMLYLFGGQDINVPTQASVTYLESLKASQGKPITIRVWPELGHSLQSWQGFFSGGYPWGYLSFIGEWAQAQVR